MTNLHISDDETLEFLGRSRVRFPERELDRAFRGKRILITGGAGSFGCALVKRVLETNCEQIIVLDVSEHALHALENSFNLKSTDVANLDRVRFVLADVKDELLVKNIIRQFNPTHVIHAAAYKFADRLEQNPAAAIRNNIFGSVSLLRACTGSSVESITNLSTDKAVQPQNILGFSKRFSECMISQFAAQTGSIRTRSIRLGNIFGSAGSVVPLFLQRIRRDKPLHVRGRDSKRFFVLAREAVEFCLLAEEFEGAGNVLVLSAGDAVSILDLANFLIRRYNSSNPGREYKSRALVTSLLPGEKSLEQLYHENMTDRTTHPQVFREIVPLQSIEQIPLAVANLAQYYRNESIDEFIREMSRCVRVIDKGCMDQILIDVS